MSSNWCNLFIRRSRGSLCYIVCRSRAENTGLRLTAIAYSVLWWLFVDCIAGWSRMSTVYCGLWRHVIFSIRTKVCGNLLSPYSGWKVPTYRNTWRHFPEDRILNTYHHEQLTSRIDKNISRIYLSSKLWIVAVTFRRTICDVYTLLRS